jgi:2-polyprenyl-3-methyl-5-hydroxy-6-metoxy-1,4-benzoquinol methylase
MMEKPIRENIPPEDLDPFINTDNFSCLYRYYVASHWCKDKTVLDAASGYGYGSMLLKTLGAKEVTCLDHQKEALEHVKNKYGLNTVQRDILENVKNDPLESKFDFVVSIETFEHVPRHYVERYIANLVKWVKPGGTIFITTPQREGFLWKYPRGGSHFYEYSWEEFVGILMTNIKGEMDIFGIHEMPAGSGHQMVAFVDTERWRNCHVMCTAILGVKKNVSKP